MANKPHKFKIGARDYLIKLPDVYDNGADFNIGTALGISKLGATEDVDPDTDTIEVGDGLKTGKLVRLRISYRTTGTNPQSKTARINCPLDKAKTAIAALVGKKYNSFEVTSAGIPRRRRLG